MYLLAEFVRERLKFTSSVAEFTAVRTWTIGLLASERALQEKLNKSNEEGRKRNGTSSIKHAIVLQSAKDTLSHKPEEQLAVENSSVKHLPKERWILHGSASYRCPLCAH